MIAKVIFNDNMLAKVTFNGVTVREEINSTKVTLASAAKKYAETAETAAEYAREYAESINADMDTKADIIIDSASGSVATFPDGADGMPVRSLVVGIEPVQSGSGDPSPDNVRPISGWTGANVIRAGKNLLNPSGVSSTVNGVTFTVNNDGTVAATGQASSSASFVYSEMTFSAPLTGTYILNGNPTGASSTSYRMRIRKYESNAWSSWTYNNGTYDLSITMTAATKIELQLLVVSGYSISGSIKYQPMLRLSGDATYVPYSNISTIPISWQSEAGAVYGGSLDVGTGVLTVDRAIISLGTLDWVYVSTSNFNMRSTTSLDDPLLPTTSSGNVDAICTVYPVLPYVSTSTTDKSLTIVFAGGDTAGRVWIHDSSYTNAATFKTAMASVNLVYRLATPITYTLTPQELFDTLKGTNNIWSDTGDTAVTYCADTKLYIDKKFAALQALILDH